MKTFSALRASRISLVTLALLSLSPPLVAGELVAADARGGLWLYGTETPSMSRLGDLPEALSALDFDADGQLYGMTALGRLYELDLPSAASRQVFSAESEDRYRYRDLAFAPDGTLYLLRHDLFSRALELIVRDLDSGLDTRLGQLSLEGAPYVLGYSLTFDSPRGLRLFDKDTFWDIDLGTLEIVRSSASFPEWNASDVVVESGQPRTWLLTDFSGGERGLRLVAVDGSGPQISEAAPAYDFPFALGPRAIALRPDSPSCSQDAETLCLRNGRFQARVEVRDFLEPVAWRPGFATHERSDSAGQFFFYERENRELLLKVLDGCAYNESFWVFVAGTTNVEVRLEVTDLQTGALSTYSNALGEVFRPKLDTNAFPCESSEEGF
ncbi:MAG: hypothetical protein AAF725_06415 [Acidobacteriota bacterium]